MTVKEFQKKKQDYVCNYCHMRKTATVSVPPAPGKCPKNRNGGPHFWNRIGGAY